MKNDGRGDGIRRWVSALGPLLGLAAVYALFALIAPRSFASLDNLQTIARQSTIVGIAALGMTLVIISGGIDLSVGSTIALVTVAIAWLLDRTPIGPLASGLGGVLCGAAVGWTIGVLVTRLRIVPFIVTLGMMLLVRGVAKGLAREQKIDAPMTWLNDLLAARAVHGSDPWMPLAVGSVAAAATLAWPVLVCLARHRRAAISAHAWKWSAGAAGVFWVLALLEWSCGVVTALLSSPPGVWFMLLFSVAVAGLLRFTVLGRHLLAVGSNEQTARLCGVRVERVKVQVYVLCGALTGLAGLMQFSRLTVGDPTVAMGKELDVIAAVVIGGGSLAGGEGSVLGSIIGALIMTVIRSGCSQMGLPNWVQEIVTGVIIVIAVGLDRLRQRRAP